MISETEKALVDQLETVSQANKDLVGVLRAEMQALRHDVERHKKECDRRFGILGDRLDKLENEK